MIDIKNRRSEVDNEEFSVILPAGAQLGLHAHEHLRHLKDEWDETIRGKGGNCPVCGQFGKIYKFSLTQTLALALKWIHDHTDETGWADVQNKGPRWMLRGKTYSMLVHWKFVRSGGKKSGIWQLTDDGRVFLQGSSLAPKAVYIYDNKVMALDAETGYFRDFFGVKFDFDALMSAQFRWENVKMLENKDA